MQNPVRLFGLEASEAASRVGEAGARRKQPCEAVDLGAGAAAPPGGRDHALLLAPPQIWVQLVSG